MKEIIKIDNFLSISHIEWEFKRFNIITGDMGTGKSVFIKLVQFFEKIIPSLLIMAFDDFINNLNKDIFYDYLKQEFFEIFTLLLSENNKNQNFTITYNFTNNEKTFNMTIKGCDENDTIIESPYLEKLLSEWNDVFQNKISTEPGIKTPDGFKEAKNSLYNDLLKEFNNLFPIATTFVPASRAALAFGSNFTDKHLREYKELIDVLPKYASRDQEIVNTILKAKTTYKDSLYLKSNDGREIPISKASSGQQEIVYVLMLLDKLNNFCYIYGKHHSIFIEEPEAHLFPLEQKQTMELIVKMFNLLKGNGNPVRFFITTHSPYVLNVCNNMLRKGSILEQNPEHVERINSEIEFPGLFVNDLSALFINNDGTKTNILIPEEDQILPEKIRDISFAINNDTINLDRLSTELL